MKLVNLFFLFTYAVFVTGCAGVDSYKFSKETFSVGSNIYLEGAYGTAKSPKDEFSLEYSNHDNGKLKASVDFGFKIGNLIISAEYGRIFNDFEKRIYDVSVAGDFRLVEKFSANTDFNRVSIIRRYMPGADVDPNAPFFFSLQAYYDFKLKSNFYRLPNGASQYLKGTAYGGALTMHLAYYYMGIGFNWRKYENNTKTQELLLNLGTTLLLF